MACSRSATDLKSPRRIRQIEPLLQEIDTQHALDPDRRAAIARLRIERLDQPAQRRPRHDALHLGKKCRPPRRLGVSFKPHCRQRQLLHPPDPMQQSIPPALYHVTAAGFCRGSLAWTTEDCAILLQAMAGHDPRDPASVSYSPPDYRTALQGSVKGLRVGLIRHF